MTTKISRPLREIARDIYADWTNVYFGAKPYLAALAEMDTPREHYGADPGKEMVLYFLANASTWHGETARRIKAELKELIK